MVWEIHPLTTYDKSKILPGLARQTNSNVTPQGARQFPAPLSYIPALCYISLCPVEPCLRNCQQFGTGSLTFRDAGFWAS